MALAILSLTFSGNAEARLGETEAECQTRYGALLERIKSSTQKTHGSDEYAAVFKKNDVRIEIEFKDGKAWRIIYEGGKSLNMPELLERNTDGASWGSSIEAFGRKHWLSPDGQAHAIGKTTSRTGRLEVFNESYLKARAAFYEEQLKNADQFRAERGAKADPLEGF